MSQLQVVNSREKTSTDIIAKLEDLLERAKSGTCVGLAAVLLFTDGSAFSCTRGRRNRLEILGAVADLQYTIGTDGDTK